MKKSAQDLIPQTVDRLVEHYQLLDTLDPTEVEAGILLEELDNLRTEFLKHQAAIIRAHLCENSFKDELVPSYSRRIEELIDSVASSPATGLALNVHVSKSVRYELPMPFNLRMYVVDRLMDHPLSSKPNKRSTVSPLRDTLIVDVIEDLVKESGLNAYGVSGEGFAGSACWVVAEAQRQLGRMPNSPRTVAKILLRARKAEKAERRDPSSAASRKIRERK